MRTIQVFTVMLCLLVGSYLLTGRGFFMPNQWEPSMGVQLAGWSSRLLGAGLLLIAYIGILALRNFGGGEHRRLPYAWHLRYFGGLVLAIALISAAFLTGEHGPTPGWRGKPASSATAPTQR